LDLEFEEDQMSLRGSQRITYTIFVTAALALLSSCIGPSNIVSSTVTEAEVEDAIYTFVNDERQSAGLDALDRDSNLDRLARLYSASGFSRDVEQSSDLNYLLCNFWRSTFSGGSPELREDTAREQVDYCLANYDLRQVLLRSDARATGLGVAILGDTIYYVQVFDVLNSVRGDGRPVQLSENAAAEDPSWELLRLFVLDDDTDEQPYIADSFVCADFAAMLHDRAEAAGIKVAYVSVVLADGLRHALNAFNTTDRGLVFIDCTGQGLNIATSGGITDIHDTTDNYDKVAYLEEGYEYGLISINRASRFDYEFYEQWMRQWEEHLDKVELYEQKVYAYEEAVGGRTVITDPDEYAMLQSMYEELETMRGKLENQENILGSYRWEPLGLITDFYVHW
jgi:hypothetical protein